MKKVFVLQDLGVPHSTLEQLHSDLDLPYDLVTEPDNPKEIEGLITIKTPVTSKAMSQFPNLKFIAVAFTGYDAVDIKAAVDNNIKVFNVPTYATDSTAELAIGLAISLLREIPKGHETTTSGGWELKPGIELKGKTIAIIGTGSIGTRTAELFKAFGCNIIGWSRSERDEFGAIGKYVDTLEGAFAHADIVSVHLPLNDDTTGMIDKDVLSKMNKTAYLVNVARGPIVNTQDLADSLNSEAIAGAAVDVYDVEPIEQDNPLLKTKNVILTPHVAYKTGEALARRAQVTLENIKAFADGKPKNVVS